MPTEFTDSIYIDLVVTACQLGEKVWMQGDLEILINGEKPYGESDLIYFDVLQKSMNEEGEHFIFSCCCGMPECSGWIKGIEVSHSESEVIWRDNNSDKSWTLSREKMEEDLRAVKAEVLSFKAFFLSKDIEYVGVGHAW